MHLQRDSLATSLSSTLNTGLEGLLLIAGDGTILHSNERAQQLLAPKNILDDSSKLHELITFYSPDDLTALKPEQTPFYIAVVEHQIRQETILGVATGLGFRWLLVNMSPFAEGSTVGFLISLVDITKIVNQNRTLKDKQQQLQLLVASLNDLVFEVTDAGVFKNYWTNDPSLLFYPPEEFLNKNLSDLFPEELANPALKLIGRSLQLDQEFEMEFQSNFENHQNKWYNLQIKPIHHSQNRVALVVSDITKQVESTEKIRFNEHKFNQAFHFSGLGMALTDLAGYCIESNHTLTKILGYSQDEIRKIKFTHITHPDDLKQDISLRHQLIQGEIETFTLQKRYQHQHGHFVWCSVTVSAVFDKSSTPLFLIVQVLDISESKKNIEILKRQKFESDLVKMDLETKVRQMEEFANILAHNLKGPLSNMQMLIDGIKDSNDEKIKANFLELLKTSNNQLTETLHDLGEILELRSNQSLTYEQCNFSDVLKKIKQQFIDEIQRKNATISTEFNVKEIYYPKIYLESILSNLISNALRFTASDKAPQIEIRTYKQEEGTLLAVKDNGLGINLPKYKSELFMFKKIFHRGFDSKGVGLFLIRYQIESLGGKIDVQSEINAGSTFSVKFLESKR